MKLVYEKMETPFGLTRKLILMVYLCYQNQNLGNPLILFCFFNFQT